MRNPRIQVVVSEKSYDVLKRCSKATGESVSSTIGSLVETVVPVLERMATIAELAEDARREMGEKLGNVFMEAEKDLLPMLAKAYEVMGVDVGIEYNGDDGGAPYVYTSTPLAEKPAAERSARARSAQGGGRRTRGKKVKTPDQ